MKVLIIVPAYNEALNIEKTVHDIQEHCTYDYVVINDCSKDNTKEVCIKNHFNFIDLPINYGLTSAIQVGFKYGIENDYDIAIQFDGDGQHQARYLKDLVCAIEEGNNIAIGSRFVTEKKPWSARMLGSRLLTALIFLITGKKITDPTSGMRAFDKDIMLEYANNMNYPPEPDTLVYMLCKNKKIKEVQVTMSDREFGESYLNPIRSITYMAEMIISILFIQIFRKR